MSKKASKTKHQCKFKTIGVNKTTSCACELKVLASLQVILNFFIFPKKWVGRAMGNETFYGDGLSEVWCTKRCPTCTEKITAII